MAFLKSKTYPGWIMDTEEGDYISPSGRTTTKPGAPFTGTLHKDTFNLVKIEADRDSVVEKSPQKQETAVAKDVTYEIVKTYTVGDITVNIIKAS